LARIIKTLASDNRTAADRTPICDAATKRARFTYLSLRQSQALPRKEYEFMPTNSMTARHVNKSLELRILQSYVLVLRAKRNADGYRVSSLERHGVYEVRLIDPPQMAHIDTIPFWLELFDHNARLTLDSGGGYDLEAAAIAADAFISRAKLLHQA
jgi:hypothetical protein